MVCVPFKPAAGTNVPANIRIVNEGYTKMLWMVLARKSCRKILADLEMWFGKSRSPSVSWKLPASTESDGDYDAWTEAPLLCKRKSTKWVIVSGVVCAFWIFCPTT
ncbi:uncharacterized protein [Procambarus clarkii]|uniref:uncharacterized protein n=1 Tax=Procambarus clarkii TaxID=6728 RepID=UPI003743F9DD